MDDELGGFFQPDPSTQPQWIKDNLEGYDGPPPPTMDEVPAR